MAIAIYKKLGYESATTMNFRSEKKERVVEEFSIPFEPAGSNNTKMSLNRLRSELPPMNTKRGGQGRMAFPHPLVFLVFFCCFGDPALASDIIVNSDTSGLNGYQGKSSSRDTALRGNSAEEPIKVKKSIAMVENYRRRIFSFF